MHKLYKALTLSLLCAFVCNSVLGQDSDVASHTITLNLEGTALLGISTGDVSLQIDGVTEAGASLNAVAENAETRLRISSLAETGVSRKISAKMSKELIGTQLSIQALPPETTNFTGDAGTYSDKTILTTTDNEIITNIGTCWSGIGDNDGYVIKYFYQIKDITPGGDAESIQGSTTVTVTYTLTDAS